jgi:hypothetical protein
VEGSTRRRGSARRCACVNGRKTKGARRVGLFVKSGAWRENKKGVQSRLVHKSRARCRKTKGGMVTESACSSCSQSRARGKTKEACAEMCERKIGERRRCSLQGCALLSTSANQYLRVPLPSFLGTRLSWLTCCGACGTQGQSQVALRRNPFGGAGLSQLLLGRSAAFGFM